ncbi:MAG TPA: hypothetical protein VLB84_00155, partial [Bacteroidia bacterium]|nr:hypothetical protein [Bacteroidia bacterium]
ERLRVARQRPLVAAELIVDHQHAVRGFLGQRQTPAAGKGYTLGELCATAQSEDIDAVGLERLEPADLGLEGATELVLVAVDAAEAALVGRKGSGQGADAEGCAGPGDGQPAAWFTNGLKIGKELTFVSKETTKRISCRLKCET